MGWANLCVYLKHNIWNLLVSVSIETVLPLMFSIHCSYCKESLGALLYGRCIQRSSLVVSHRKHEASFRLSVRHSTWGFMSRYTSVI